MFLLFGLLCVPSQLQASDWTTLRQNETNRNSVIEQPHLPFHELGTIQSQFTTPVVSGDLLITAQSLASTNRQIVAYQLTTLKQLWTYSLGSDVPSQLAMKDGVVYFGLFTKPQVIALDATTGQKTWQTMLTSDIRVNFAPIIIDQWLFVPGHERLHRLSLDGQYQWNRLYDIRSSLATDGKGLYLRLHNQRVIKMNPETGVEEWAFTTGTTAGTEPILSDDMVYVGANGLLYALSAATGQKQWTHNTGSSVIGNVSVIGDRVIYTTSLGTIASVRKETGEKLWSTPLSSGSIIPLFIVAGDTALVRSSATDHTIVNILDGSIVNRQTIVAPNALFQAVASQRVFINELSGGALFRTHVMNTENWTVSTLEKPVEPPKAIHPVVVIPGILGSWRTNGEWKIDPVFKVYDGLLDGLREAGYKDDETLFTFPYDWHISNKLTGEMLRSVITCIKERTGANKVDLIAHSMGGLVARSYIQGPTYENDVDELITLATPHHGSLKAYLTWEAGEDGPGLISKLKEQLIAYEAKKAGYKSTVSYIHEKMPSIQDLLPIFNYLYQDNQLLSYLPCTTLYPCNSFLEQLAKTEDKLRASTDFFNIIGDTDQLATYRLFTVKPSLVPGSWEHGMPLNYPANDGFLTGTGDGTVLTSSAKISSDSELTLDAHHTSIVSEAISKVVEKLTSKQIAMRQWKEPQSIAFIRAYSPIDMQLIDSQGRRSGIDFATGQLLTEIPNVHYSGNNTSEEYFVITNPLEELELRTKATGTDLYTLGYSVLTEKTTKDATITRVAVLGDTDSYKLAEPSSDSIEIAEEVGDEPARCQAQKKVLQLLLEKKNKQPDKALATHKELAQRLCKQ